LPLDLSRWSREHSLIRRTATGTGEFSINGVATQVMRGDMVFAESNVLHGVRNTGQTQMMFYIIKTMGKSFS